MSKDTMIVNSGAKLLFIYDGIPIGYSKDVMTLIDPHSLDSIFHIKRAVFSCDYEKVYDAMMDVRSTDSTNVALKYILAETDSWIFSNPLSSLYLNGEKTDWIEGFGILSEMDSANISTLEVRSRYRGRDCDNGKMIITLTAK